MQKTIPSNGMDGHGRVADSKPVSPIGFALSEVVETPGQRLMAAVLWDAINCYVSHAQTRDASQRRLHHAAARWIGNGDIEWPYSFENICTALGLDAATIRRQLRARCLGKEGNGARAPGAPGVPRCAA